MKKHNDKFIFLLQGVALIALPLPSVASGLDGSTLAIMWSTPFIAILLLVALAPMLIPTIWHQHFGKIMLGVVLTLLIPFAWQYGMTLSSHLIWHAVLLEYLPFILLLLALFTVSGGIVVTGSIRASTRVNIVILLLGTLLASLMGTTGAAMLLIRPLLRFNAHRQHKTHLVIFFIFLVANIGGGLTPLGDPPLFLGFLNGVDFSWTLYHMWLPIVVATAFLLVVFYWIDRYFLRKEPQDMWVDNVAIPQKIVVKGKINIVLLLGVVASVVLSGVWHPNCYYTVLGQRLALQELVSAGLMLVIALLSLSLTPKICHQENEFSWEPMKEVAKLFIAIFITITPVIWMLRAGEQGALAGIVHLVSDGQGAPVNHIYFWVTGLLSGFLDNAPTYLVFFNLAAGNAQILMTTLQTTLLAISMGAVFMGALTYIGNAPNFMVRSIAQQQGITMPSFLGYMKWSFLILIPLFLLLTWLFF